ncbi:MAG: hypothetical protein M0T74_14670 [Desulfitobacterium hafniense]|nr:hypothetical protein [Desulfitobacterium hafniense]
MKTDSQLKILTLLTVAIITFTLFTFEILLTRLFSAIMFYHYVFIAISLAILSIGLGGIYVFTKAKRTHHEAKENLYQTLMKNSSLLMAISITVNALVIYKIPYNQLLFFPYLIMAAIPFIAAGIFISSAFKRFSGWSNLLYFSDLLGSAIGGIAVVKLLQYYSILRVSIMLSLLPLLVYLLFNTIMTKQQKTRSVALSITWIILALVVFTGGTYIDKWSSNFTAYNGGAKVLGTLNNPQILFTAWNAFTRTDVVKTNNQDEMFILLDGSAASPMIRFNGDWDKVEYLKKEVGYLPFITGNSKDALLIGPGGGQDILLAKLANTKTIDAVEINPATIKATELFSQYSGNPYKLPGVNTYVRDGRSFIESTNKNYDVIYLSKVMTQASEALGYALSENYIYTLEAFQTYMGRLKPDGRLAMVLHDENDLQKAMITAIKVMEKQGLNKDEAFNRMAIVVPKSSGEHSHGIMYPLLLIKNEPFTTDEGQKLIDTVKETGQEPLLIPGIVNRTNTLSTINDGSFTGIKPATDDSPFFYNSGVRTVSLLFLTLIAVLVIGKRYFGFAMGKKTTLSPFTYYFMLLGAGFMFIEVPLVQKFVMFFGHPTIAFTVVIATLLFFGGIGSMFGKFLSEIVSIRYSTIVVALYSLILMFLLSWIFSNWQSSLLSNKIALTLLVLGPLGFAMGMPFPSGLKMVARLQDDSIPLMWGVNGWMSVVGSILSMIVAMLLGFKWSLLIGAIFYISAMGLVKPMKARIIKSATK